MKCDYCDSKATVFLTQIADGEMKKIRLCETCAKERGVTNPTEFSLSDFMQKGFAEAPVESGQAPISMGAGKACPQCGFKIEDFEKVRRFGCGTCYQVFSAELGQMLQGMHKGVAHKGKVPENQAATEILSHQLGELKEKLKAAVTAESYEEAAALRDQINSLKSKEAKL